MGNITFRMILISMMNKLRSCSEFDHEDICDTGFENSYVFFQEYHFGMKVFSCKLYDSLILRLAAWIIAGTVILFVFRR